MDEKNLSKNNDTKQAKPPFTKEMIIADVVKFYPEVVEVLFEYGLHCIGCHISGFETVEQGAIAHGIAGDNLRNMMLDAYDRIKETKKNKSKF